MKIGIEVTIDVTKIEKERIYQGKKGKYLTMTAFVDPINQDQYGNNGMVTHKKNQDEQQAPILGNTKVFWSEGLPVSQQGVVSQQQTGGFQQGSTGFQKSGFQPNHSFNQQKKQQQSVGSNAAMDEDIPFAPIAKQYKNLINCI